MPLNLKDNAETPEKDATKPEPILHSPKESSSTTPIIIIVVALIAVGAIGFWLYKSGRLPFLKPKASQQIALNPPAEGKVVAQPETTVNTTPAQIETTTTSIPVVEEKPEMKKVEVPEVKTEKKSETNETTTPPKSEGTGRYTIYIGSYKSKSIADGEAGRWSQAGYSAFVVEIPGWFRVAIGRYSTSKEARGEAVKLKDSFEYGYWIGPVR